MAAVPLVLAGLSLAGGLLGNRKQNIESSQTQNSAGDQTQYGNSQPLYDPLSEDMRQKLIYSYANGLDEDPNLSGYKAQGLSQIQQSGAARDIALRNSLASRGLSYSNIAPIAQQQNDNSRIGESNSFINTIPLLRRQLIDQRLNAAGSFFKGLPVGTSSFQQGTQHSGSSMHGVNVQPGNVAGGGIGSLGTTLAGLYGRGAFSGGNGGGFMGNQTGAK